MTDDSDRERARLGVVGHRARSAGLYENRVTERRHCHAARLRYQDQSIFRRTTDDFLYCRLVYTKLILKSIL